MAETAPSRTPALHRSCNSTPGGYFDFSPATHSDGAIILNAMQTTKTHRLDAFHDRPSPVFEYPEDAHIYAARPLPAVPMIPALRRPSSAKSLRSPTSLRPSMTSASRTITTDCIKPLPPLPLRTSLQHQRGPSMESMASSKPASVAEIAPYSRPRQVRSISFRNFLNRNTYPQAIPEPLRSASSMSESSDSSCGHDSRHDSVFSDEMTSSKTTTPATSTASSRRPSTLSLASLRSRKISQESVPAVPVRPSTSGKANPTIATRRWNLFSGKAVEGTENMPPVPITPPPTTELSCHRCYYFSMRNCNGWVMGGTHGESCESCTMHGFFGSP